MAALIRLLLLALVLAAPARAQQGGGSGYAIDGIAVDVAAPTPEAARSAAFRIAQRQGWALLWSRLTGGAVASAPRLSDPQLDSIVSGIESQGERFSQTRYIAKLGVIFDRSRARDFLAGSGAMLQSPPMLLLPLFSDGGVSTLYQSNTPWRAAWGRYRENVTPIDYVVASGSAGDNLLLTSWQVRRPDRPSWRNILNRFDAVDVLTAEARLVREFPGGPIRALFIARHGPDATELSRFTLSAADESELATMLDAAVRQIDEIYAIALRDGRLRSEPDLTADLAPIIASAPIIGAPLVGSTPEDLDAIISSVEAIFASPDPATLSALETAVRTTPGVTGVIITSLSLGGTSRLIINYSSSRDELLYALDGRGLRLATENGQTVLRRRRDGDAPVPRPVPVIVADDPAPLVPPGAPLISPAAPPSAAIPGPAPPVRTPEPPQNAPVDLLPRPPA